jgi:hypothetical protein
LLVLHNCMLFAQPPTGTDALWSELEEQVQRGNRRALRDLATFLDKPVYADATRRTLLRYTFFTKNEINVSTATREEMLGFFYEQESALKFSEIIKGFYKTPIEEQSLDSLLFQNKLQDEKNTAAADPSVRFHFLTQKFDSLCLKEVETYEIQVVIEEINAFKSIESYDWLRRNLATEPLGQRSSDVYLVLCEGLRTDPSVESLEAIMKAVERGLVRSELLSSVFLDITNVAISAKQTQQLLDTLGNLEAVRSYGYDHSVTFKAAFFYEMVDYYGKILSTPNAPHWIKRNALHDLLATHNPRLLFFLAAQVRLKPDLKDFYINLLQKLTNYNLIYQESQTPNQSEEDKDIEKWKNFVTWWGIHSEDFEWDKTTERFISRTEMVARTEEIERLTRRLGSPNDSVALASFQQLTENDPSVVTAMMEKFRPLLRTYNARLPEINYPFLENMTLYSAYCRSRKISLQIAPSIDSLWSKLVSADNPSQRYIIENQIIEQLTIKDISAIEYYGLLYSNDVQMNFSVSRILDIFYSKHGQESIADDNALRLYFKKSALFERIGTGGTSSMYERKLNPKDSLLHERLGKIVRTEGDVDIRKGMLKWLTPKPVMRYDDFTEIKTDVKKQSPIEGKIEMLESAPEILIEEINDFVSNPSYGAKYKPFLIKFLKKTAPLSTIRHFKLKNTLTASKDLSLFADMHIAPKDLDDFLSIFKIDNENKEVDAQAQLWQFVEAQTAPYSIDESGSFWNTMFKIPWFNNLIYDGIKPVQKDSILATMRNYLTNSELLSEFEEQTTQMHIAELENIGRTLTEKLTNTLQLEGSNTIKAAVQTAILARISYDDIGTVAAFSENINEQSASESPLHFLQNDFGIPIFSDDKETLAELSENHKKMSPKAFYTFYLKRFGLKIWQPNGSLDYEKVYDVLKHESVIPFTGGGGQRDYFTFGVIKLLEFEFNTRLGFHEKLNENQTFYTYNTSKRANAWRQLLVVKNLVKICPSVPPSFKS